jgi:hypothetical protein
MRSTGLMPTNAGGKDPCRAIDFRYCHFSTARVTIGVTLSAPGVTALLEQE